MSNKDYYKALGIKKGDPLSLRQIIQIAQMRTHRETGEELEVSGPGTPMEDLGTEKQVDPKDPEVCTDQDIIEAVYALSPDNADHWTGAGLPAMKAIEGLVGTNRVGRSDIERLLPSYTRASAKG